MYEKITGDDPYKTPMRIFPAVHYTMGGLWVDYNLMSNIPGLHVLGEANFSDHGANRLGASALMQGLADGYFVIPYTIGHFLASTKLPKIDVNHDAFKAAKIEAQAKIDGLLKIKGQKSPDEIHRQLGHIMWEKVGMARTKESCTAAIQDIRKLRDEFYSNLKIIGEANYVNPELEKAGRVADFLELAELMAHDALERNESCGGHFREEYATPDGEAVRDDEKYCYAAAWEWGGAKTAPVLHKEDLVFERIKLATRSYK